MSFFRLGWLSSQYEVAPDGQRFLFVVAEREAPESPTVTVVFNWLPESKR